VRNIFLSFIGNNDLNGLNNRTEDSKKLGPFSFIYKTLLRQKQINDVIILNDWKEERINDLELKEKLETNFPKIPLKVINTRKLLSSYNPSNHKQVNLLLELISKEFSLDDTFWHINLTSGTPTIISMLLIFGKTHLNAKFYQTYYNREVGKEVFEESDVPFDISLSLVNSRIEESIADKNMSDNIIGNSQAIKTAIVKAQKIAMFDVPCFIFGETGTGKELIAKEISIKSNRVNYNAINCSVLSDELAASTLFGYVKGAFTGASSDKKGVLKTCDNGILFLDEIGDLSLKVQTQLLRFIQEGEFTPVGSNKIEKSDVKIIAATHKDIYEMINDNTFREDLFYRLAVDIIEIPPLRERKDDIPVLAEYFLDKINKEYCLNRNIKFEEKEFHSTALNELSKEKWKGNIRELEHTIRRIIIWSTNKKITADDVRQYVFRIPQKLHQISIPEFPINVKKHLQEYEQKIIAEALTKAKNNQIKAAELIGMDKTTLNKKIKKYNL